MTHLLSLLSFISALVLMPTDKNHKISRRHFILRRIVSKFKCTAHVSTTPSSFKWGGGEKIDGGKVEFDIQACSCMAGLAFQVLAIF